MNINGEAGGIGIRYASNAVVSGRERAASTAVEEAPLLEGQAQENQADPMGLAVVVGCQQVAPQGAAGMEAMPRLLLMNTIEQ